MHLYLLGAGHVGLVSAAGFARLGYTVTVADVNAERIDALQCGAVPIFEPALEERLRACAADGLIRYTTDLQPPPDARVSIVCVGTPSDEDGPLSMRDVEAVLARLLEALGPEDIIVVRSTLPLNGPDRLVELASRFPRRPAIVTNPEFMREGSAVADFDQPSRVITGWLEERDRDAAHRIAALYMALDAPTLTADARSTNLIKLASNAFLAAKVTFANELARICDAIGADVGTVVDGIGSDDRIGRRFLDPGPGIGGSCLPEQALALALQAGAHGAETPLIDSVTRSNETHQSRIAGRIRDRVGVDGSLVGRRIAVLGLSFKANTNDVRHSPALALARRLREAGAIVSAYDPRASDRARVADPLLSVADEPLDALRGADAVLVATEWPDFRRIDWHEAARAMRGTLVFDTRAIVDAEAVRAAGLDYEALGAGRPVAAGGSPQLGVKRETNVPVGVGPEAS
jgi:UDPglucose 6-dehydrogenase